MIARLTRIKGPACTKCGCRHSERLETSMIWGKEMELRRCRHCAQRFHVEQSQRESEPKEPPPRPKVLRYAKNSCPQCESADTRVTSTRDWGRYHKCGGCGHKWKTLKA